MKLLLSGTSTAFWNTDQCYKNTPALGSGATLEVSADSSGVSTRVFGVSAVGTAALGYLQEGCVSHKALE